MSRIPDLNLLQWFYNNSKNETNVLRTLSSDVFAAGVTKSYPWCKGLMKGVT